MTLEQIFDSYKIKLKNNDIYRHPVDILEDMFLKLSTEEYRRMMELVSQIESKEGPLFDIARGRSYE